MLKKSFNFVFRNVVTGEHFRFVNFWMGKTAYVPAVVCMLIFVSILLSFCDS